MILIALGANLPSRFGSPAETLRAAVKAMEIQGIETVFSSRIWMSAPVPVSDQPWFHNGVVAVKTGLSPFAVLERLQHIEKDFGRVRTVRNAARVLDLDLIAYNDEILDKPELIVPHPRLQKRAFVLLPLREVAPDWIHPVSGRTVAGLAAALPAGQEIRPLENESLAA